MLKTKQGAGDKLQDVLLEAREIHSSVVALSDGDRLVLNDDNSLQHLVKSLTGWNHQG